VPYYKKETPKGSLFLISGHRAIFPDAENTWGPRKLACGVLSRCHILIKLSGKEGFFF
jgi:hypothetical protein